MKYRVILSFLLIMLIPTASFALPDSCNEFQKLSESRGRIIAQINGFKSKKPSADQACSVLSHLIQADAKILSWMGENKDWCQIPDDVVTGLKQASGQSANFRNKACSAAVQQKKQIGQMRRQQQQQQGGQIAPGAGVKLPQGAL